MDLSLGVIPVRALPKLILVSVLLLFTSCEMKIGGEGWGKKKRETLPVPAPVRVVGVRTGSISSYLLFHAVLSPEKEVQVFPRTIGIVITRYAEEGDRVHTGQLLAKLEDSEQQLALARADTAFKHQVAEAGHAEKLYSQGMLSDEEIRRARLAKSNAEISLEQAKLALDYTSIKSPFTGVITRRAFDVGDRVDQSRPLFTLVDQSRLYADCWVSESELPFIRTGDIARIRTQSDSTVSGYAKALRIANVVDPVYGKIKVTFLLEPAQLQFKSGQFVEILLTLETHDQALLIPKRALLYEAGKPVVFIVRDTLALHRPVITGIGEGGIIEILNGLFQNDSVVVDGHATLQDSARVKPQNGGSG